MKIDKKPTQVPQPPRILTDDSLRAVVAATRASLFHLPNMSTRWR